MTYCQRSWGRRHPHAEAAPGAVLKLIIRPGITFFGRLSALAGEAAI
jgi:hypothetical protein